MYDVLALGDRLFQLAPLQLATGATKSVSIDYAVGSSQLPTTPPKRPDYLLYGLFAALALVVIVLVVVAMRQRRSV